MADAYDEMERLMKEYEALAQSDLPAALEKMIDLYFDETYHTYKVITKISRPNKGRLSFCPLNRGRVAAWGTAANRSCRMGHYARSVEVSCIRPFR